MNFRRASLLTVAAAAWAAAAFGWTRADLKGSSSASVKLTDKCIYDVRGTVRCTGPGGKSAFVVGSGNVVALCLRSGCQLTVQGGAGLAGTADGQQQDNLHCGNVYPGQPGGAGIEVLSGGSLIIFGDGSITASGGQAAKGGTGGWAATSRCGSDDSETGQGGPGGWGGHGGGAAIGSVGGVGGPGGEPPPSGKKIGHNGDHVTYADKPNGNQGTKPKSDASIPGSVYLLGRVKVTATGGGNATAGGDAGGAGTPNDAGHSHMETWYRYFVGCGGGGGGGGGGYGAPYGIGPGGYGGGGGGSGSRGKYERYWWGNTNKRFTVGQGGAGGEGAQTGTTGTTRTKDSDWGVERGEATAGTGGGCGEDPTDVTGGTLRGLYKANEVNYSDGGRRGARPASTIISQETFYQGSDSKLSFNFVFDEDLAQPLETLYGDWPANVTPPEKAHFIFRGFYTGRNRSGERVFKSDGTPQVRFLFVEDTPLYAFFEDERLVEWTGIKINGRDLAYESGAGWDWDSASGLLTISGTVLTDTYTLSGTNTQRKIGIALTTSANLVFDGLHLQDQQAPSYPLLTVKPDCTAKLQVLSESSLATRMVVQPPLRVDGHLVITNVSTASRHCVLNLTAQQGVPGLALGKGASCVQEGVVLNVSAGGSAPAVACTDAGEASYRLCGGTLWVAGGESAADDIGGTKGDAKLRLTVDGGSLGSARESAGTQKVYDSAGKTLRRIRTGVPDTPNDFTAVVLTNVTTAGATFAYGTKDVFPKDGFVYVWRPDGATTFTVDGMRGWARDDNGWTEAHFCQSGLTLDGRNVARARGPGWNWSPATSNLLFTGDATITVEGTDVTGQVHPIVDRNTSLTLHAVTLAGWGVKDGVFEVRAGTLTLALTGDNRLYGLERFRGTALSVDPEAALKVSGTGSLTAEGGFRGAGIGGAYGGTGALTFTSGTVLATGGFEGAGIGGACGVPGGSVTVADGAKVTAQGGYGAAGVGGGAWATGGRLTGEVQATGGRWADGVGNGNLACGRTKVAAESGTAKSHVEVTEASDAALRSAVASLSAAGGGDITFAPALDGATIRLVRRLPLNAGGGNVRMLSAGGVTLAKADGWTEAADGLGGGALLHAGRGELTLTGVAFEGFRTSGAGGAIRTEGPLVLENCTFRNCQADGYGGALYAETNAPVTATGCRFAGNRSVQACGGAVFGRDAVTLSRCALDGNSAEWAGGAVGTFAPFDVTACESASFLRNVAGVRGGGLDVLTRPLLVAACTFTGNAGGALCADERFVLASTISSGNTTYLAGLKPDTEIGLHATSAQAYKCTFGAPDLRGTFTSCTGGAAPERIFLRTTADVRKVDGVEHVFRKLTHANKRHVQGCVVWHAAGWSALSVSDRLAGSRTVLYGETTGSLRTETDQLGVRREDANLLVGAVVAAAEPESLTVTTSEDRVDPEDGQTSLREAIAYASSTDLAMRDDAFREITFADALKTGPDAFDLTVTNGTLTVDGGRLVAISGGADAVARSLTWGGATAKLFEVASDGALSLENLTLFGAGSGVLASSAGALQVQNCRLDGRGANRCAAEVSSGRAWFERCTLSGLKGSKTLALDMTGGTGHLMDVTLCGNVADSGANAVVVGAAATLDLANVTAAENAFTGGGAVLSSASAQGLCLANCALVGNTSDGALLDFKATTGVLSAYSTWGKCQGTPSDYAQSLSGKTVSECLRLPADSRRRRGVRHAYYGQVAKGAVHRNGCIVYSSVVWDCLAYALSATGAGRSSLRGSVSYATQRVKTDVLGRDIVAGYVSRGSYATERDGEGGEVGAFAVNTPIDFEEHLTEHDYDGLLTLREAVEMAEEDPENRDAQSDCTIRFADGFFEGRTANLVRLSREAIAVTRNFESGRLRIVGRTDRGTGIDGRARYRLFRVAASNRVAFANLLFTNGVGTVVEPVNAAGGALWNGGDTIVSNCAFVGSSAGGGRDPARLFGQAAGGAVYTAGGANTVLLDCSFSANFAGYGGALFTAGGGRSVAVASTFTGNRALAGNYITAPHGGAVAGNCTDGPSETLLVNCTLAGNASEGPGGAAYVTGVGTTYVLDILSSIVLGNASADGFDFGTDARAKVCHTVYGARAPGLDGKWLDRSSAGGRTAGDVFATDDSGAPRVETLQVGAVPHAIVPVLASFRDAMPDCGAFVRGYGTWSDVAYAPTGVARAAALCGSLSRALRYGTVWTRDETGVEWATPVVGATTLTGIGVNLTRTDGSVAHFASLADAAVQARAGDTLEVVSEDVDVPESLALASGVRASGRVAAAVCNFARANEWYTVTEGAGGATLALNAKAAPALDAQSETDLAEPDAVRVVPSNVKPYLYYALGRSATPVGPYVAEGGWVRARADGTLPAALTAPKAGSSGFYRVLVRDFPE